MSIRKRGKYYIVDVQVGSQRARRSARNRAEARRLEASLRQQLIDAKAPHRGIEEALLKYLKEYAPYLKDFVGQKSKARSIRPHIKNKTFEHIAEVVTAIKEEGEKQNHKPATTNRKLALLRRLANLAYEEWGWLTQPLGKRVKMIPERNSRHIYLTVEQVDKLAARCSQGASDAIRLAAMTGLRRGELFALDKNNVIKGQYLVLASETTKTNLPRLVPVPETARDILKRIPLKTTPDILRNEWEEAREKEKLSHVHFHDLRHTYASWLAQANVALNVIGELLGHSQTSTTKRYAHLRTEDLEQAVKKIS